jgi:Heparinase II/III-like protein/Heparinase II/III N-terminus
MTPPGGKPISASFSRASLQPILALPSRDALLEVMRDHFQDLIAEADEIVAGNVRLFGGTPVSLELEPPRELQPLAHWTQYEQEKSHYLAGQDIKFLWEPGRFGWVFPLVRAYQVTGNVTYAQAFWSLTERFLKTNPPNLGPQWASGQEVALRLIALVFGGMAFCSPQFATSEQISLLQEALVHHGRRIALTLVYARSQNNNHLLTEAAGLYTAGLALPGFVEAEGWRQASWRWFHHGLQAQIAPDGTYVQHSANYHRLMLQAALWVHALTRQHGEAFPDASLERLSAATSWLADLLDPDTGHAPNLGANDGAMIFPMAVGDYRDYRPVLQSASLAFLSKPVFSSGPWDEQRLWLNIHSDEKSEKLTQNQISEISKINNRQSKILNPQSQSWASIRAAHFTSRPSHADQLHVELWWRGINLASDAGTYLYNAPPPWDNPLARTAVHNTIEIDGQDQMLRAGRFLWLDWAQGEIVEHTTDLEGNWERIVARHDGYRRIGVIHERALEKIGSNCWQVTDRILPTNKNHSDNRILHTIRLHWLLPDYQWEFDGMCLTLRSPFGPVSLQIQVEQKDPNREHNNSRSSLVRAGEVIVGEDFSNPNLGWFSPTYGRKSPALSIIFQTTATPPLKMTSLWVLPTLDKK